MGMYIFSFYLDRTTARYFLRKVGVFFQLAPMKIVYNTLVDALSQETLASMEETSQALSSGKKMNQNGPLLAICGIIEQKNQFDQFISMNGALKFLTLLSKEVRKNTTSPLPIMDFESNNAPSITVASIDKQDDSSASAYQNEAATALCGVLHETNKTYLPMKKDAMALAVSECYKSLAATLSLQNKNAPETHQHLQRVLDSILYTLCKISVAQGQYEDASNLKSVPENGYAMFAKTCY